jgi:hypothetical protein
MNRFRAPFALLFQILLLQVSVLGGGMACAPEWMSAVAASQVAASHGHDAGHGTHGAVAHAASARSSAEVSASAPEGAERGTTPHHGGPLSHCASASGCAAIGVPAPVATAASVAPVDPSETVLRVTAPRWTHPAPEPPPPRA